jgi:histidinol-phosphatase (PHP family)
LGFTEHLYRCVESEDVLGPFWESAPNNTILRETMEIVRRDRVLSIADYIDTINRAKERGLPVLLGLEVDFSPESYGRVLEFLGHYQFDYLIGSVHWIDGWIFDRTISIPEIKARGARRMYEQYFDLKTQLAGARGVDVLAHADRCKAKAIVPEKEPIDLYEKLVGATSASGLAVEVSSGGLRQLVAEVNPAPALLRLFREADVPITLASDAHYPEQAGWGHEEVVAAARAAGYEQYLRFEPPAHRLVPLPRR